MVTSEDWQTDDLPQVPFSILGYTESKRRQERAGGEMTRASIDLSPELATPLDIGCVRAKMLGYNGKCVSCPFSKCLEDTSYAITTKLVRNLGIIKLNQAGIGYVNIAKQLGMSPRMVQRIINNRNNYTAIGYQGSMDVSRSV